MEIKNPVETLITIINPGNGLPDVSPLSFVRIDWRDGSGNICDKSYLCSFLYGWPGV